MIDNHFLWTYASPNPNQYHPSLNLKPRLLAQQATIGKHFLFKTKKPLKVESCPQIFNNIPFSAIYLNTDFCVWLLPTTDG